MGDIPQIRNQIRWRIGVSDLERIKLACDPIPLLIHPCLSTRSSDAASSVSVPRPPQVRLSTSSSDLPPSLPRLYL